MRSSILLPVGLAAAWVALTPVPCRAQFEIAPDHFEMKNVEAISPSKSNIATNHNPRRRQIPGEGRGNDNYSYASYQAAGKNKSNDVHLQFDLLGFSIAIDACEYGATQPSKPLQVIARIWTQARVQLNYFSFSRKATLPRGTLQHKS